MAKPGSAVCIGPLDKAQKPVRLRVICIPQAGMGAWAFHGWQQHAPAGVELLPVEMPGRNSRMAEPKPETMGALVAGLADGLIEYGAFKRPYVLLGHSLGAWVAYELHAELERRGKKPPRLIIVSGNRPPHLYGDANDADRVMPSISKLPADEFWQHFERRYGVNPDLDEPMVKTMVE